MSVYAFSWLNNGLEGYKIKYIVNRTSVILLSTLSSANLFHKPKKDSLSPESRKVISELLLIDFDSLYI